MSWSRKFPEPLRTSNGRTLRTLAEAGAFILKLSPQITWRNEWQYAADKLMLASKGKATVAAAREAVETALFLSMLLDFGDERRQRAGTKARG